MNYHQLSTLWDLSILAIIVAGLIGWLPVFTGTVIPFCIVCFQVSFFLICTLITLRVWKQQRKEAKERGLVQGHSEQR